MTEGKGRGISTELQSNNTSGIPGVYREFTKGKNGEVSVSWRASFKDSRGKERRIGRSINKYGEVEALRCVIEARRDNLDELLLTDKHRDDEGVLELYYFYEDLLQDLFELQSDKPQKSIIEIALDENVTATTKLAQIKARVGQQRFRREVLKNFNGRCCVTGVDILIRASHIKPWSTANDVERLDPMNGLALSPSYDLAFDQGFISFDEKGYIVLSTEHTKNLMAMGISSTAKIKGIKDAHMGYLNWHRECVFIS
ncbi:HNH endonuclease [Rubritalea sp.]|uniref:HNH endonuclease n=1 Tax=Rubritalea sp. TaxID=2109375 RepID=UPI003EF6E31D